MARKQDNDQSAKLIALLEQVAMGVTALTERVTALEKAPAQVATVVAATRTPTPTRIASPDEDLQRKAIECGAAPRRVQKANRMFAKADRAGLQDYHDNRLVAESNRRYVQHLIDTLDGKQPAKPVGKRSRTTGSTASQASKRASHSPPGKGLSMEPAAVRTREWRAAEKAAGRDPYRRKAQ